MFSCQPTVVKAFGTITAMKKYFDIDKTIKPTVGLKVHIQYHSFPVYKEFHSTVNKHSQGGCKLWLEQFENFLMKERKWEKLFSANYQNTFKKFSK